MLRSLADIHYFVCVCVGGRPMERHQLSLHVPQLHTRWRQDRENSLSCTELPWCKSLGHYFHSCWVKWFRKNLTFYKIIDRFFFFFRRTRFGMTRNVVSHVRSIYLYMNAFRDIFILYYNPIFNFKSLYSFCFFNIYIYSWNLKSFLTFSCFSVQAPHANHSALPHWQT